MASPATAADLNWFANFEVLTKKVLFYDFHKNEVFLAQDVLEWPIIWVLGRYHKKHIMCGKSALNIERASNVIKEFINRVKWKAHFGINRHDDHDDVGDKV